jgi:FAD/FMN-containing dehydrogenase/Fe-S oxidoreductase
MFRVSEDTLFRELSEALDGEFYFEKNTVDQTMLRLFATDASAYQEMPVAVALPKHIKDLQRLIIFASKNGLSLIPRAAGTSLAGQVVGNGIVVDISKNFNEIVELNIAEKWVKVQPGVIRNDLNAFLNPSKLMLGPETSTANRAMIGGMIGNNSCGLHSIVWGDTRQSILELEVLLADGSLVNLNAETLNNESEGLLGQISANLNVLLRDKDNQKAISEGFADPKITRRNTGYALDQVISSNNICQLIAGSEGTLCFIVSAKLKLLDVPPAEVGLVNVHCSSMRESLEVNLIALAHNCYASELMDDFTLAFTKDNIEHQKNRAFVVGTPKTILMVEFFGETRAELDGFISKFIDELKSKQLGFSYPILYNEESLKAWELRKAALGLLSNQRGDYQPTNLIEDCAVLPADLPAYIAEMEELLQKHKLPYAISAHAGAGELHIIPMMNLRTPMGVELFRTVLAETAVIVKKYRGSLSGEHGDGRLRGEFIPFMMGEKNYELFKEVKQIFDPRGIFNKGKITDSPSMNTFLRVQQAGKTEKIATVFDFSKEEGILRLAEKCSGSGDCRKTHISGGTMCPSYMATRHEKDSTRARANILRHYYTELQPELESGAKDILDLCLSCKGCKSECPSGVDVGKMKAEFMQAYYDSHGAPLRSKLIGAFDSMMRLASIAPWVYNFIYTNKKLSAFTNTLLGFHPERSMPILANQTFKTWFKKRPKLKNTGKKVYVFADEFSNYNDVETAKNLVLLLENLNYSVEIPEHTISGRSYLSKGFVRKAKEIANKNTSLLKGKISAETPLIGIEPSAILTFRDEYLDLVSTDLQAAAEDIAKNTFLFEEWFLREIEAGNIKKSSFTEEQKLIKLHGHCHQKALAGQVSSKKAMSFPVNYKVELIPSGCCGMAGSFGYEKEHFELSNQVANLVLFPTIKKLQSDVIIAAPGTSCRHQIKDGLNKIAQHPIDILWDALIK